MQKGLSKITNTGSWTFDGSNAILDSPQKKKEPLMDSSLKMDRMTDEDLVDLINKNLDKVKDKETGQPKMPDIKLKGIPKGELRYLMKKYLPYLLM